VVKWSVVATKPARERLACTQLKNQGFEVFFPEIRKIILRGGLERALRKPLFPGYLFVAYEEDATRWRSINGTLGVKNLLMQSQKPGVLPSGFVEALQENCSDDGLVAQYRFLSVGDKASIASGAFATHIGKLLEVDAKGRVAILLNLLASERRVVTRLENLTPV